MVRADVFRALLRFSAVRLRRLHFLARVLAAAPTGGESPSYFKDRPHDRKVQAGSGRLAALGGHFVLHFGVKNELASVGEKKIFIHS